MIRNAATPTPRRILLLDHTARWSGGEIALFRFLGALDRSRYEPVVVLGEDGVFAEKLHEIAVETVVELLGDGVRETRKDTLAAGGLAQKMLSASPALLSYARRIADLAKTWGCSLIHTNSLKSDVYGAIAAKQAKLPLLWHVRDHIAPPYLPNITVHAMRFMAMRVPTHVLCNSRSTLFSLFGGDETAATAPGATKRFTVVADCVGASFLTAPRPTERDAWRKTGDSRPITIGIVGRLARWKGQHIFLAAAKIVQEKWQAAGNIIPLQFVIAGAALFGEEIYESEIKAQALRDFPPGVVQCCGNVSDVPALMASLDVLVHCSILPEPFGQVVIEGMAMGLPVIATRGGGVVDIITPEQNGLLTPMGDVEILAQTLLKLLNDPGRAATLGQNGYDTVRSHYLPERTARKIESVYDTLLQ
ncbi:MAG: glycosyltransferase family 4 protein [Armatimonadetes bacterium]|nr:glycosyltransferase family 4 protein [Armatimonadota bacterium]